MSAYIAALAGIPNIAVEGIMLNERALCRARQLLDAVLLAGHADLDWRGAGHGADFDPLHDQ
jgi:hypothetical protein